MPNPTLPEVEREISLREEVGADANLYWLRALRDALIENAAQAKQIQELTNALAWIGDKAVCDWDDPTVGDVRRALENVPQTYRDAYAAYTTQTNQLYDEMRALGPVEWECIKYVGGSYTPCEIGDKCLSSHRRAIRVVKGGACARKGEINVLPKMRRQRRAGISIRPYRVP
jgi:hypothetical protein